MNRKALEAYRKELVEIEALMEKANDLVDKAADEDREKINWGHVGSMVAFKKNLEEAIEFIPKAEKVKKINLIPLQKLDW